MDCGHHLHGRCYVRLSTCILHTQHVQVPVHVAKMESVPNFDVLLDISNLDRREDLHHDNDYTYDQNFWRCRYTHACRT